MNLALGCEMGDATLEIWGAPLEHCEAAVAAEQEE